MIVRGIDLEFHFVESEEMGLPGLVKFAVNEFIDGRMFSGQQILQAETLAFGK